MLAFTCARRRRYPLGLAESVNRLERLELLERLERLERLAWLGRLSAKWASGRRTRGCSSTRDGWTWRSGFGQGLPLVHFSAQPEPFLSLKRGH